MSVVEGRAEVVIRREDALRLVDRRPARFEVTAEGLADAMHEEVCIPAGFRPGDYSGLRGDLHRQMHLAKARALIGRAAK